jgi:hypothetical protein
MKYLSFVKVNKFPLVLKERRGEGRGRKGKGGEEKKGRKEGKEVFIVDVLVCSPTP